MRQQEPVSDRPSPAPVPPPTRPSRRWLQRTLAADPPRAKSLIVTVWGDALAPHGGARLARRPHPADGAVRRSTTDSCAPACSGWRATAGSTASSHGRRSRYRLTRDGARRFDDALSPHLRPRRPTTGTAQWELVLVDAVPPAQRARAARRARVGRLRRARAGARSSGRARPVARCRRSSRRRASADGIRGRPATDFPGARPLADGRGPRVGPATRSRPTIGSSCSASAR